MAVQPDCLESINALRGIAFLGVLLVHVEQGSGRKLLQEPRRRSDLHANAHVQASRIVR
jgi:hypothetical protein